MKSKNYLFFVILILAANAAFAASGGLAKAESTITEIRDGFYAVVGIGAGLYLLWVGVMCFSEKKQWSDFGWAVLYVALVGAAVALASWAWTVFI